MVQTRAEAFGFELVVGTLDDLAGHEVFGALLQYPDTHGEIRDLRPAIEQLRPAGVGLRGGRPAQPAVADPPGELGADVVLGSTQRFGVPMGYGGPHAAYFASRDEFKRGMPGRIIGVSRTPAATPRCAWRCRPASSISVARRPTPTSAPRRCCWPTSLASMRSITARRASSIAQRVHRLTAILAAGLEQKGIVRLNRHFFDTLTLEVGGAQTAIIESAEAAQINLRILGRGRLGVSLDETCDERTVEQLLAIFLGADHGLDVAALDAGELAAGIPAGLQRERLPGASGVQLAPQRNRDAALPQAAGKQGSGAEPGDDPARLLHHETQRHQRNDSDHLGRIRQPHPFVPRGQALGYRLMIEELEAWLCAITGFDAISMQPNSGAQGEYAGLVAIRKYHESRGEGQRDICLIPSSAHGTNPASAQMVSMRVVIVECDKGGNVDLEDLKRKAAEAGDRLSCLMITYPSTHGVYEKTCARSAPRSTPRAARCTWTAPTSTPRSAWRDRRTSVPTSRT